MSDEIRMKRNRKHVALKKQEFYFTNERCLECTRSCHLGRDDGASQLLQVSGWYCFGGSVDLVRMYRKITYIDCKKNVRKLRGGWQVRNGIH